LLAHARHAGDVVGAVAEQGLELHEALRRHAPLRLHLRGPHPLVAHPVVQAHVRSDELAEILVPRHDDHVETLLHGLPGQRGVSGRCALYPGSICERKARPSRSQTTATWVGEASRSDLSSMRVKPKTARVGRPDEVESSVRMAW